MIRKILQRIVVLLGFAGILVLAGSSVMPINAEATEHSRTFGENGGLSWSYDESTKTVTITGEDEVNEIDYEGGFPKWEKMDISIEKFQFQDCKVKGSMERAFYYSVGESLNDAKNSSPFEIDLSGLDTTEVKGIITINGQTYTFDDNTGTLLSGAEGLFWLHIDGKEYWYEDWTRQGWDTSNEAYRGKEIFDPDSNAWYWLDNVQQGAKAVSKDVYQESQADDAGNVGKWVRYDENGHMIKGWNTNENGTYYFDLIYGTMLKGEQTIEGITYFFDENIGILQE